MCDRSSSPFRKITRISLFWREKNAIKVFLDAHTFTHTTSFPEFVISSSSSSNLLTFLSLSLCPRFLIPCQLSLLSLYWKQIIFFTLSDSSQTVGKNRSIFITVRPIFSPTHTHTEIVNAFLVDSLCRENDAEHKKFISRILISSFIPLNVELYNSFFFSLNIFEFFNH